MAKRRAPPAREKPHWTEAWFEKNRENIKPCPFCGATIGNLYIGHRDAMSFEIACWPPAGGCGARIGEPLPDEWPDGLPRGRGPGLEPHHPLYRWCLDRVLERWNRRV